MRVWNIGDTCYKGKVMGKIVGLVWPGPKLVDGVVTLPLHQSQKPNNEAIACLVAFKGHRGFVKVNSGELTRVMAMPIRVTAKTG